MKKIQVFDPALCCSTGVCGVDADQELINFSADVEWARQQGALIERFNLAQQPMVFAENQIITAFLQLSGKDGLPVILLDGEIVLAGRYPSRAELALWVDISPSDDETKPAKSCCSGSNCC
jgi:hypothetical protein